MAKKRIVFYSQHLVGVGHHFRNRQIIRALADEYDVYFVDGGRPVPGATLPVSVQIHHLTPVFKDLVTGHLTSETGYDIQTVLKTRKQTLNSLITRVCPEVFIIEYFPFTRWDQRHCKDWREVLEVKWRHLGLTSASCSSAQVG